jgi:hypothetical protein
LVAEVENQTATDRQRQTDRDRQTAKNEYAKHDAERTYTTTTTTTGNVKRAAAVLCRERGVRIAPQQSLGQLQFAVGDGPVQRRVTLLVLCVNVYCLALQDLHGNICVERKRRREMSGVEGGRGREERRRGRRRKRGRGMRRTTTAAAAAAAVIANRHIRCRWRQ